MKRYIVKRAIPKFNSGTYIPVGEVVEVEVTLDLPGGYNPSLAKFKWRGEVYFIQGWMNYLRRLSPLEELAGAG